ncbi:hypothetical protein CUMW_262100 [Citrus unshiu]|uniref:Uncharacterized protein n=1 Tax=Citrus unshiu TaxID=55188 RepID=A0A2H5QU75_CITUN|nr:hypothetical protein CUMW_262100 [Citrus unshiu]
MTLILLLILSRFVKLFPTPRAKSKHNLSDSDVLKEVELLIWSLTLPHSSTMEPTLAPMAVERTMTARAAALVGLGLF